MEKRNVGLLIAGLSLLHVLLYKIKPLAAYTLFWYLITLYIPSIIIKITGSKLEVEQYECEGLKNAGKYIGYLERSLVFFAFLLNYFSGETNPLMVIGTISFIFGGKGLFRFGGSSKRACAEWYILGTFMSLTLALFLSWLFFFILAGILAG